MTGRILKTLHEQINPAHTALLVIDPQKDFCADDGAMARVAGLDMSPIQATVTPLNAFIQTAREAGIFIVWMREVRPQSRMLLAQKVIHGEEEEQWLIREGSDGTDWYEGVIQPLSNEPVVTKWDYDGFENTDLHLILRNRGILTLVMTGFQTNVCVETTARHGYTKGYYIVMVSDCTNACNPEEHTAALNNIRLYFGKVATSTELTEVWGV